MSTEKNTFLKNRFVSFRLTEIERKRLHLATNGGRLKGEIIRRALTEYLDRQDRQQ